MKNLKQSFANALVVAFLVSLTSAGFAQLPDPGMKIDPEPTAIVITDPQNDFLSPDGATWAMVGKSVTENNTVANIRIMATTSGVDILTGWLPPFGSFALDGRGVGILPIRAHR